MRYQELGEDAMSDILIRGLDEGTVSRLDALAVQRRVSRNTVIRSILDEATRTPVKIDPEDALEALACVADLGNPEVMAGAWR